MAGMSSVRALGLFAVLGIITPVQAQPTTWARSVRDTVRGVDMLDVFAVIVLLVLAITVVVVIVVLGSLPGKIARKRNHPYAQAVTVAGWIGLIFIVLWPLALIWAYVDVPRAAPAATEWNDLRQRLSRAETELHIKEAAE
jgi:amino acid transporter